MCKHLTSALDQARSWIWISIVSPNQQWFMCNALSVEAHEKQCSKRIMSSAVTMRNCVAVALIQVRDGLGARPDGKSIHQQKRDPMKIYESEKILFEAPSGAPSFRHMNSYESENDAFFFCLLRRHSRKWFTAAWKSYKSEPFHRYAALARSTGSSLAFQRKFIRRNSEVY
jgi:hypothetical protein